MVDAFKQVPIHPTLWPLHGLKWDNQYYFFTWLVFGSRSSPKIFDSLSSANCWIARHNYNVTYTLHLLDDFLVINAPHTDADRSITLLTMIFGQLHLPLSKPKTIGPSHCLEYLGITLDTENMQARLPEDKLHRHLRTPPACSSGSNIQFLCQILNKYRHGGGARAKP